MPASVVLGDATLSEIAERRPASLADLEGVIGLGPIKVDEYGDTLLAVVAEHAGRPAASARPTEPSD